MGTPAKVRYCALCGTAKTSGGRKYCTACLKVVRKKNAEEHNWFDYESFFKDKENEEACTSD